MSCSLQHGHITLDGRNPANLEQKGLTRLSACEVFKGSLDEKLPIYEQDPKSKRLDSFEKRCVRD